MTTTPWWCISCVDFGRIVGVAVIKSICLFALLLLTVGCAEVADPPSDDGNVYVRADTHAPGDGSRERPFGTLAEAEANSGPGDHILLLAGDELLDGSIALKPNQKLTGVDNRDGGMVQITNSAGSTDRPVVALASGVEVANLHFVDLRGPGVLGDIVDISGVNIHHNRFTRAVASDQPIWAIKLATNVDVSRATVTDNLVRDGESLGGVQVLQFGSSTASYEFARNEFYELGHRAYHLWSQDTSTLNAEIVDSKADNIGRGDNNSDSILPHLSGRSTQNVVVTNYHYRNTDQVGNASNCGLEAFIMGAPFEGEALWCDGCKLTLRIDDSLFDGPATDGIQLINFGSNSEMHVEIRGTTILNPKPKQVGGGISLLPENEQNTGNRVTLLVENSQVIGSSAYGIAVADGGEGYSSIVDLGGGELGSAGNNRIVGSAQGEIQVIKATVVAKHNWWGGEAPRIDIEGDATSVSVDPLLAEDPDA